MTSKNRPILAIIGRGDQCTAEQISWAERLGELAIESGYRVVTGGRGGVMAAACRGAHRASNYCDGDTLGFLPGESAQEANQWTDIVMPTGLGIARNVLVVRVAQAVIAIGGGAGTLSEIALAWQLKKPIIALSKSDGWAEICAGQTLDDRRDDKIHRASSPEEAIQLANDMRS